MLGRGLSIIVDLINPQKVLLGGVYSRQPHLFESEMRRALGDEAIEAPRAVCTVEAAALGERIGDLAALAVAAEALSSRPAHARGEVD